METVAEFVHNYRIRQSYLTKIVTYSDLIHFDPILIIHLVTLKRIAANAIQIIQNIFAIIDTNLPLLTTSIDDIYYATNIDKLEKEYILEVGLIDPILDLINPSIKNPIDKYNSIRYTEPESILKQASASSDQGIRSRLRPLKPPKNTEPPKTELHTKSHFFRKKTIRKEYKDTINNIKKLEKDVTDLRTAIESLKDSLQSSGFKKGL